ncbi:MAG TPA: cell division topological specificity factor MinE [Bacillota bacterium]|nr:cell division topological specificity factor MinE [Candidatus Fermentithermobacillaceae bacterium]HOB30202.1 cell division topological specificity factor MinE [Bacillota bacterium]HOK64189.1 cell division topological specificity factor MinE [Bacillota bacterium]HOL11698.1 cell division topological specificity factor MinE [Bacillota bacterium]HOQ02826.1 cell division topological specificity factor MinE [Bacillota bacterium]
MFDFFKLFKRKEKSKEVAHDRLKLVLMQDRLAITPQTMENMKDAIIVAISEFVEIDEQALEFDWEDTDRNKVLVASIPIRSVKRGASQAGGTTKH